MSTSTPFLTFSSGFYGVPGRTPRLREGKVHAVKNGQPLCGWKPAPPLEFQWCARGPSASALRMIECKRCRRVLQLKGLLPC